MPRNSKKPEADTDAIWGAEAIGREIDRTAEQVRYLISKGALEGAVKKVGHRTFVGSRQKLREFAATQAA